MSLPVVSNPRSGQLTITTDDVTGLDALLEQMKYFASQVRPGDVCKVSIDMSFHGPSTTHVSACDGPSTLVPTSVQTLFNEYALAYDMTFEELVVKIGISRTTMDNLVRGGRPLLKTLNKIIKAAPTPVLAQKARQIFANNQ